MFSKKYTADEGNPPLARLFEEDIKSSLVNWYVDHFTKYLDQYGVRHFCEDPFVSWTNEDAEMSNTWTPQDVAEWFGKTCYDVVSPLQYVHYITVRLEEKEHTLKLAAFHASVDGDEKEGAIWDSYVKHGIRGALERGTGFSLASMDLVSVEVKEIIV